MGATGERELVTPPLDGTILPGVTRDSILQLCRDWNEFKVSERMVPMAELVEAVEKGQVAFSVCLPNSKGLGLAAVLTRCCWAAVAGFGDVRGWNCSHCVPNQRNPIRGPEEGSSDPLGSRQSRCNVWPFGCSVGACPDGYSGRAEFSHLCFFFGSRMESFMSCISHLLFCCPQYGNVEHHWSVVVD